MRRITSLLLAAVLALTVAPALAQDRPETGIVLAVADWLRWDEGGGWIVLPAGAAFGKTAAIVTTPATAVAPGAYDVYWDQGDAADPVLVAAGVAVTAGAITEVDAATGIALETADWVPPRVAGAGWFGAILPTATDFDFVNRTRLGDALFLPIGTYDVYYEADENDPYPPIWLGTYDVEPVFGGIGVEVTEADGAINVVRTAPGGPGALAGLLPNDTILAVDGQTVAGLALGDAVALIRGTPDTQLVLTIRRGAETLDLTIVRQAVSPRRIVSATGGIRFLLPDGAAPIGPDGWWGVVYAGDEPNPEAFVNWQDGGADRILLLGPADYDVYWDPVGDVGAQLVAEDVAVYGTVVDVAAPAAPAPLPPKVP